MTVRRRHLQMGAEGEAKNQTTLRLVEGTCALCGTRSAEPVGVGEDFEYRTCTDSFLVVQCRRCGLVYLDRRPADEELARIYPDDYHAFDFSPRQFGLVYRVRGRLEGHRLLTAAKGLREGGRILRDPVCWRQ